MLRCITAFLVALFLSQTISAQVEHDVFGLSSNISPIGWRQEYSEVGSEKEHESANKWEPLFEPEESPFDERIETERHDFTQSTKVVGRGVRQFEYGFFFSSKETSTEREQTYATPELLFRYGFSERGEFRMRFNYVWKFIEDEEDIDGGEDLRLSLKYVLSEQCNWRPESAVELRTSAPSGADAISTGRWQGGIDYIYGWEFADRYSFAASTGVNGNALGDVAFLDPDSDPDDRFLAWTQSAVLGAELSEKSTAYFEWFGIFTHGRDDETSPSYLNVGIDRYLNDNALIDFRIGWGLNEDSDDIFAGVGSAFRF